MLSEVDIFIAMGSAEEKGKARAKQAFVDALNKPVPQDRIIEAQEVEIARLKLELSHSEDRYLDMKKQFDELKVILRET